MRIYMDHNATSPLCAAAATAMADAAGRSLGNPSSVHEAGRRARDLVERARRQVAELVGADISELVFTSGGTEADRLGVASLAAAVPGPIWTTDTAHPALSGAADAQGRGAARLAIDGSGLIHLDAVADACASGSAVIAIELANHELGVVQQVAEVVAIAHEHGALVHCDAVQAVGRVLVDVRELGVDSLAMSGHKLGGPMGVGALWLRPSTACSLPAPGGQQERGRRPGTENVLGIIGFGAAAAHAQSERVPAAPRVAALCGRLEAGLLSLDGVSVHGAGAPRVGNTINARIEGALGEVVVQALDLEGIAVSTGAACSSGNNAPSPALLAIGLTADEAREAIRISLGPESTEHDAQVLLEVLPAIIARARAFR